MRALTFSILAGLAFSLAASAPAAAQDTQPVAYMTQHKVQWSRMDSLSTLIAQYQVPWHNFIAENVEGYQRWHFVHDTGNEYNYMTLTMYPDWDMVRGGEIPYDDLFPQYLASIGMTMEEFEAEEDGVSAAFEWALEGDVHMDQIWVPIEPEAEDN